MTSINFRKLLFYPLLLVTLLLTTNSYAQTVNEYATVDSLKVGDTFNYSITLNRSKQYEQVVFPDSSDFGDIFEIRSKHHYQVSTYKDSISYQLQFFATSDTTVPPLPVALIQSQDTATVYTNPVYIPFNSVLAKDEKEFRPLKPIFSFAAAWWPYIVGLIILTVAAYLFYKYYWQQRETEESTPKKTFTPEAFVNPLSELEETIKGLHNREFQTREDFDAFYVALGDAIRQYYERLYDIPALESTSSELLTALHQRAIDQNLVKDTRAVLQEADMVKFAKFQPTQQQAKRALTKAHNFLERAQSVDGARVQHLERKHRARMEAERERFNQQQEEVTA